MAAGLDPTEIVDGQIHRSFTLNDPGGRINRVDHSHVVGIV
jgi:hypothetical protein